MNARAVPIVVRVQREDFDLAAETAKLQSSGAGIGAIVTFSGICRDEGGALSALELEHYPGMAEAEITRICEEAVARFALNGIAAIHRFGKILPGENIVLVIAASTHRRAAFDGASFVMDYLKTSAPFWKKEHGSDGEERGWVSASDADDSARHRWKKPDGNA